jgi:SAM-dependent methyltransferase
LNDALFAHPRLAPVYDAFEGARDDLAHYLAIADELGAHHILDVGCGTGSLATLLAGHGRTVVGVDPAEASLAIARAKDERVTWLHGDATTLPPLAADLAVMAGNVVQQISTDEDWAATLDGIHAALRPGGHLVFETRRPARRAWEDWPGDPVTLTVPDVGPVTRSLALTDVRLPYVSFRCDYRFHADDTTVTSDSTLRFRDQDEVADDLTAHGYHVLDVRDAPDRPGREFVFLARRGAR